jgi:hypothetical protein
MNDTILIIGALIIVWLLVSTWLAYRKRLRFGESLLTFTSKVTKEEAQRVGEYLVQKGIFNNTSTDAQLDRDGTIYQLRWMQFFSQPVPELDLAAEVLAGGLSEDVFAGQPVEVHLCDGWLQSKSIATHRRRFGNRLAMNGAVLFYLSGITPEEALRVATFLAHAGLFNDSPKVAQMNRSEDGYEFRLAVYMELTPEMTEGAKQMATDLSRNVLGNAPVTVVYCLGLEQTLRVRPEEELQKDEPVVPSGPYRTEIYTVPKQTNEQ